MSNNENLSTNIEILSDGNGLYFNSLFIKESIEKIITLKNDKNLQNFILYLEKLTTDAHEVYEEAKANIVEKSFEDVLVKEVEVNQNKVSCKANSFLGRVYNELGRAYLYSEDVNNSRACFETSQALDADNLNSLYNLADLAFQCKNFEESINFCDKLTEKSSTYVGAVYLKGLCYSSMGEPEKAVEFFQKTVELDSESFGGNYWSGECLLHTTDYDKALPYFKKCYELSKGDHKESARGYAICELAVGDPQAALDVCDKLIENDGANQIMALQIKGDALILLDKVAEGAACHAYLASIELDARDFVTNRAHKIAKEHGNEKAMLYAHVILDKLPDMYTSFAFLFDAFSLKEFKTDN